MEILQSYAKQSVYSNEFIYGKKGLHIEMVLSTTGDNIGALHDPSVSVGLVVWQEIGVSAGPAFIPHTAAGPCDVLVEGNYKGGRGAGNMGWVSARKT